MKCIYCNFELPLNAKFCPKCMNQVICLDCNEILYKDSPICIVCGSPIKKNPLQSSSTMNTIEFTENEQGKTFKAAFTDPVAGSVVETFAQLLPVNNNYSSKKVLSSATTMPRDIEDIQDIEVVVPNNEPTISPVYPKIPNDLLDLEKIFKNKDGNISIYDTRIKAKSRSDFSSRITILFLYYKDLQGVSEVPRRDVNAILQSEKLYDGGFRGWLSKSRTLIDSNSNFLELRPEGRELAIQYLSDFLDNAIPNGWDLKSCGKRNNTSKEGETKDNLTPINTKAKSSKKSLVYQIIQTLDLKPAGKKSLKDFSSEYAIKSNFEYNLVFVYYLEKILNEKSISINHLYTCYKELSVKVPNINQSLLDTKRRKGWIETKNMNDLKVPILGENHLEHDMKTNK